MRYDWGYDKSHVSTVCLATPQPTGGHVAEDTAARVFGVWHDLGAACQALCAWVARLQESSPWSESSILTGHMESTSDTGLEHTVRSYRQHQCPLLS